MVFKHVIANDVNLRKFPTKKYSVVYADPPWPIGQWNVNKTKPKYNILTMDALAKIPVPTILKDDACLFMWVIEAHLEDAFKLIRDWGFEYVCVAFVWGKVKVGDASAACPGMGFWTRKASEMCLFAKHGKPKRISKNIPQLILEPRREHSRKPLIIYDYIEQMTKGARIELFARTSRGGLGLLGQRNYKI